MTSIFGELSYISWGEACLRVFLALVFSLVLGLDRDAKNKPIDFRAYMIVCVTTCIISMMVLELHQELLKNSEVLDIDLGKIISGVLTGIGFLGAGAIIKRENEQVVGTATGASIWASGGIGLALGFGAYGLAFICFISIAGILMLGGLYMSVFQGKQDKENIKMN